MRLPEQKVWDRFRRELNKHGIWYERIENLVATGTPDLRVCTPAGGHLEIEMKSTNKPIRANSKLLGRQKGLRPEQKGWLSRYRKAGGGGFVLIGVWHSAKMCELLALPASLAYELNDFTYEEAIEASIARGPAGIIELIKGTYHVN